MSPAAWLMAASQEINGPPGKSFSLLIAMAIVGLLAMQPDFGQACLVLFSWGVMYFVAGAPFFDGAAGNDAGLGLGSAGIYDPHDLQGRGVGLEAWPQTDPFEECLTGLKEGRRAQIGARPIIGDGGRRIDANHRKPGRAKGCCRGQPGNTAPEHQNTR